MKDYNVMVDGKNFFVQPFKNDIRHMITFECLLDYPYFRKCYRLIAINLSKQQKQEAYPKALQQINFTGNLKVKQYYYWRSKSKSFSFRLFKVLWFYFVLVKY